MASVEPVMPEGGPAALTAAGPWQLQIAQGAKDKDGNPIPEEPMSGRVRLHFAVAGSVPASKTIQHTLNFTPVPGEHAARRHRHTARHALRRPAFAVGHPGDLQRRPDRLHGHRG